MLHLISSKTARHVGWLAANLAVPVIAKKALNFTSEKLVDAAKDSNLKIKVDLTLPS